MDKKFDVTALGELLIDFTENGMSDQGNPLLESNPGGAPCNVLAMLAKCGRKASIIGKVGDDQFGEFLKVTAESAGIDVGNLIMDNDVHTTLSFVHRLPDGDREFSFYRSPGADMMLRKEEVQAERIEASRIFHFGTLSFTSKCAREATRYAIKIAKDAGLLISFDPNLRESLWNDLEDAKEAIGYGIEHCDILKIADNEVVFMTGEEDLDRGVRMLQEKYNTPLIFLTMGKEGSRAYYGDTCVEEKPFLLDNTVETTGAGDTFAGCALHKILDTGIENLNAKILSDILTFANAGAALITTKKGALKGMPELEDIESLIVSQNRYEI